jgi:hypothetical protein
VITPELEAEYRRLLIQEDVEDLLVSAEDIRRRAPLYSSRVLTDVRNALITRRDFQGILNSVSDQIEEFAPQVMESYHRAAQQNKEPGLFSTDVDVMCAEFPKGEFEGSARPVGQRGVLVLINSGLLAVLGQTAKLIALTTAFADDSSEFQYRDQAPLAPFGQTAAQALADVLGAYLGRNTPLAGAVALPAEPNDRVRMDDLYRGLVFFTVAHEYAHAYAHQYSYHQAGGKPAALEGEADWLAVKLMLGRWRWGNLSNQDRMREQSAMLPAPLIWFGLERLVAQAEELEGTAADLDVILASHSPTMIREAELRNYYDRAGLPRKLADSYEGWIWRQARAVHKALGREPPSAEAT